MAGAGGSGDDLGSGLDAGEVDGNVVNAADVAQAAIDTEGGGRGVGWWGIIRKVRRAQGGIYVCAFTFAPHAHGIDGEAGNFVNAYDLDVVESTNDSVSCVWCVWVVVFTEARVLFEFTYAI